MCQPAQLTTRNDGPATGSQPSSGMIWMIPSNCSCLGNPMSNRGIRYDTSTLNDHNWGGGNRQNIFYLASPTSYRRHHLSAGRSSAQYGTSTQDTLPSSADQPPPDRHRCPASEGSRTAPWFFSPAVNAACPDARMAAVPKQPKNWVGNPANAQKKRPLASLPAPTTYVGLVVAHSNRVAEPSLLVKIAVMQVNEVLFRCWNRIRTVR